MQHLSLELLAKRQSFLSLMMFLSSRQRRHVKTSWTSSAIFGTSQPPVKSPVVKDFSEAFNEMVVKHSKWLEWPNDIDSIFFNVVTCRPCGRTVQNTLPIHGIFGSHTQTLWLHHLPMVNGFLRKRSLRIYVPGLNLRCRATFIEGTASLWDSASEKFIDVTPAKTSSTQPWSYFAGWFQ